MKISVFSNCKQVVSIKLFFLIQVSDGVDSTKWSAVKAAFLEAYGDLQEFSPTEDSLSPASDDLLKQGCFLNFNILLTPRVTWGLI